MAEAQVQSPEKDDPSMHPAGFVDDLRALSQATSVDLLSSSTRGELDKLLLTSLLGYVVAASKITKLSLGGFEVETSLFWAVPVAVLLINLYLIASFGILARADVLRWRAVYTINAAPLTKLASELQSQVKDPAEIDDGDMMAISEQRSFEQEASLITQSSKTPVDLEGLQLGISIVFPIAFSLSSIVLVGIDLMFLR